MSQLILDSLTIYGLDSTPSKFTVNNNDFTPTVKPQTQIVEVRGMRLSMTMNQTITWTFPDFQTVESPDFVNADPKYRIDCHPDPSASEYDCRNRGCTWDTSFGWGIVACMIPKEKGGYKLVENSQNISSPISQFTLTRISQSNQFSMFGRDINDLKLQIDTSGADMIRLRIRDQNKKRYEVPVPIQWQPATPSTEAKIKFELTKTKNGQAGFRVRRTRTNTILFDTSYFAEGFVYDDQFIQLITTIPSQNVYGKIVC